MGGAITLVGAVVDGAESAVKGGAKDIRLGILRLTGKRASDDPRIQKACMSLFAAVAAARQLEAYTEEEADSIIEEFIKPWPWRTAEGPHEMRMCAESLGRRVLCYAKLKEVYPKEPSETIKNAAQGLSGVTSAGKPRYKNLKGFESDCIQARYDLLDSCWIACGNIPATNWLPELKAQLPDDANELDVTFSKELAKGLEAIFVLERQNLANHLKRHIQWYGDLGNYLTSPQEKPIEDMTIEGYGVRPPTEEEYLQVVDTYRAELTGGNICPACSLAHLGTGRFRYRSDEVKFWKAAALVKLDKLPTTEEELREWNILSHSTEDDPKDGRGISYPTDRYPPSPTDPELVQHHRYPTNGLTHKGILTLCAIADPKNPLVDSILCHSFTLRGDPRTLDFTKTLPSGEGVVCPITILSSAGSKFTFTTVAAEELVLDVVPGETAASVAEHIRAARFPACARVQLLTSDGSVLAAGEALRPVAAGYLASDPPRASVAKDD